MVSLNAPRSGENDPNKLKLPHYLNLIIIDKSIIEVCSGTKPAGLPVVG